MRLRLKNIIPSLLFTLIFLLILEIVSSTLLPLFGFINYRIPFNILILLYIGFKLETPWIALLILSVQYLHSFFSNEGWALGTFTGTMICILVSYVRDLIHFNTIFATMLVTQIFQTIWFLIVSTMIYIQVPNSNLIIEKFWRFFPESIFISIISPFFYMILDRVWKSDQSEGFGEGGL